MQSYEKLLLANKAWCKEKTQLNKQFFTELAKDQSPGFLWIGCSDSRVPAEEVTGAKPGEIFVHRNVANLVVASDLNLMSVLSYAVETLKVPQIIVCGHYGCGGVRAATSNQPLGILNMWLRSIKDVYHQHRSEIERAPDQHRRLVELNVIEQVYSLAKTSTVQSAWKDREDPILHGWVFDIATGMLHTLCQVTRTTPLDDVYRFNFR